VTRAVTEGILRTTSPLIHHGVASCVLERAVRWWSIGLTELAKGQNTLHQFPGSKSVTSWQLSRLRGSYGETCLMDFGHRCWSTELTNAANGTAAADPGRLAANRRTNPRTC